MSEFNKHNKVLELDKVLSLLSNHCSCDDARYEAESIKPETDINLARSLMNQTRDAHMLLARFGGPSFGGLINVNNAVFRADAGGVLTLRELLNIAADLHVFRTIISWRSTCAGVSTVLDILFNGIVPNKFLEDAIKNAILSEDEVADSASKELADIRRKIRAQEASVRDKLNSVTHSPAYSKYLQDSVITMRNGRFVVPVKAEHRSEVSGLVHDTSSSGATVFIEPIGVVEANNKIKLLKNKEQEEIERIIAELSATAGSFANSLKASYECAVELNVIFAKAQLAYEMKACVPQINDEGIIELRSARHPLINKKDVVAVDIKLGGEFDTLVITGPNTGGKTVSIKTIGLLTLMAMCGLMLPVADRSKISVFHNVLADIGDEQSIEQSLSTFSSHMTNIIDILRITDNRTLVLIDELGAGTDPVEGAALAIAILEKLRSLGAKVAATTHYAELKAYALQTEGVINGSCEFDITTLKPTYKLLIGVPGRSNAFAVSARLGLNKDIVNEAQKLVSSENTQFEDVVDKLEKSRRDMEGEKEQAEKIKLQAQAELENAQKLKEEIQTLRDSEAQKAKAQAEKITENAKREAYALLNELDKLKKEQAKSNNASEMAKRARAVVKRGVGAIDAASDPIISRENDENYVLPRSLKIGDCVIIADIGSEAEVTKLANQKGLVEVQMGSMKTRVDEKNLRLIEKAKKQKSTAVRKSGSKMDSRMNIKAETSLDLRGMTVDDCLLTLDRFMDNALRTGLSEFTIIHGKGTGALRKSVRHYLDNSKFVKAHRLGTFGEGEDGVTIVTIK